MHPCWWGYWPVTSDARLGEQVGWAQKACRKTVAPLAKRWRPGGWRSWHRPNDTLPGRRHSGCDVEGRVEGQSAEGQREERPAAETACAAGAACAAASGGDGQRPPACSAPPASGALQASGAAPLATQRGHRLAASPQGGRARGRSLCSSPCPVEQSWEPQVAPSVAASRPPPHRPRRSSTPRGPRGPGGTSSKPEEAMASALRPPPPGRKWPLADRRPWSKRGLRRSERRANLSRGGRRRRRWRDLPGG